MKHIDLAYWDEAVERGLRLASDFPLPLFGLVNRPGELICASIMCETPSDRPDSAFGFQAGLAFASFPSGERSLLFHTRQFDASGQPPETQRGTRMFTHWEAEGCPRYGHVADIPDIPAIPSPSHGPDGILLISQVRLGEEVYPCLMSAQWRLPDDHGRGYLIDVYSDTAFLEAQVFDGTGEMTPHQALSLIEQSASIQKHPELLVLYRDELARTRVALIQQLSAKQAGDTL